MNKNLHRVVFNAARGLRMAVQETAMSMGKATGATSGLVGTALASLLVSTAAHGQIVAAPNAPGSQRPTVLMAPNGVPLVNIQTPSAAGVSRNVYNRFDVQRNGVILNNSRTNVQTQLGGFVQGNPWLARGPARVILNEINSGNPTQLRGAIEVGGQRAEVVVANPAGIAVDGGYSLDGMAKLLIKEAKALLDIGDAAGAAAKVADAQSAANRALHETYKDHMRAAMEKPVVSDNKLAAMIDELFRPNAKVGNGSTAAALRYELATGQPVQGSILAPDASAVTLTLLI